MQDIKTNKMKKYIRTEVVKAEPMSEFEAIEKNYRFRIAGDDSDWEEGYHTKEFTLGGRIYDNWITKDVFEKAYKPSETVLDRLKIERYELRERIEKLEDFIGLNFSEATEKAGSLQAALLVCQRSYMVNYLDVLETRIALLENDNKK